LSPDFALLVFYALGSRFIAIRGHEMNFFFPLCKTKTPEGKFSVKKFEFGRSFGLNLEEDCHEVEVTPNLELLVTFNLSLKGVCHELYT
jgi:hypothetical protein